MARGVAKLRRLLFGGLAIAEQGLRPTIGTYQFTPAFRELRLYRKETVQPCFIYRGVIEFLLAANALKLPSRHLMSQLPGFMKGTAQ
jgi:hypothetical protein